MAERPRRLQVRGASLSIELASPDAPGPPATPCAHTMASRAASRPASLRTLSSQLATNVCRSLPVLKRAQRRRRTLAPVRLDHLCLRCRRRRAESTSWLTRATTPSWCTAPTSPCPQSTAGRSARPRRLQLAGVGVAAGAGAGEAGRRHPQRPGKGAAVGVGVGEAGPQQPLPQQLRATATTRTMTRRRRRPSSPSTHGRTSPTTTSPFACSTRVPSSPRSTRASTGCRVSASSRPYDYEWSSVLE